MQHPTEKSAKDIVACAVLTEQEVVIVGPKGVHYLRTFKRQLKETVVQLRASHMWPQAPEVYTGREFELQHIFSEWYSKAYSEDTPLFAFPHMCC